MENLISPTNNYLDGFSENFLRNAYENIFNDTGRFYSLLYNQFVGKADKESDKSVQVAVPTRYPDIQATRKTKTILLADDDEDDRDFFKEALNEIKIRTKIMIFKDGAELMNHLSGNGHPLPDLIFLDLNMPKKNGMECLEEMRNNEFLKNIPVAIYSTSAAAEDIQESYAKGANIYIKKPNDFVLIKKILSDVISINWDLHYRSMETFVIKSL